jgi:RNA polymerase sigma-70 factor (ECF subfamily)
MQPEAQPSNDGASTARRSAKPAVLTEMLDAIPRLQPLARLWAPDEEAAADLLQDTLERGLRRADSYRSGSNACAWLRAIMYHLAVDGTRRQRRDGRLLDRYRTTEVASDVPAPDEPEPPRPVLTATVADVRRAAEALNEPLRGTFLLWLDERLSYKEISQRQRIPSNTVATRLLRARRQVRRMAATCAAPLPPPAPAEAAGCHP